MALKRNSYQSVTWPKTPIVKDLKGFWINDTNVLKATNNLLSDSCARIKLWGRSRYYQQRRNFIHILP
jgi:hypothetical protein